MATASIDVYVKLPSGKAVTSVHRHTDTVADIAAHLARGEGVSAGRVKLKYQGKVLDKSKTIAYLGICRETILKAEVIFPRDWALCVTFPDGRCEQVPVHNTDTVTSLKRKLNDIEGIAPAKQCLKLRNGGYVTGDDSMLCDTGVTNECMIDFTEKIVAKTSTNTTTTDEEKVEIDEEKKQELLGTFDSAGRNVEVVFCFDTTGSMYSCLQRVRQKLRESCIRLLRDIPTVRIGLMSHGDYCDYSNYIVRYVDLTSDLDTLVDFADNVPATGGGDAPEVRQKLRETCRRLLRDIPNITIGMMANGDYCDYGNYVVRYVDVTSDVETLVDFAENVPSTGGGGNGGEAYEWALRKAQQLDWSEDSAKAFVMIGDELPHRPSMTDLGLSWRAELDVLTGMGVKVYGVHALNRSASKPFYEELADRSGGYYLPLAHFDLITDMFLAVCYREADPGQLDAFVEEVEREGRLTGETKVLLDRLEEDAPTQQQIVSRPTRYVSAPWWDHTLDTAGSPQYEYVQETDTFRPCDRTAVTSSYHTSVTPRYHTVIAGKPKSRFRKLICWS